MSHVRTITNAVYISDFYGVALHDAGDRTLCRLGSQGVRPWTTRTQRCQCNPCSKRNAITRLTGATPPWARRTPPCDRSSSMGAPWIHGAFHATKTRYRLQCTECKEKMCSFYLYAAQHRRHRGARVPYGGQTRKRPRCLGAGATSGGG